MTDENASKTPSDLSIEVYTSPARPFTSPPRVSPQMSLRDALLGLKVGRRHRPFQDRPGRREGWAPHPMPLVTCDYAPFGRGWQETFDSAPGCPCGTPCRVESGQTALALSRSAGALRGLGSAPDAISHLRLCAVRPWLARDFRFSPLTPAKEDVDITGELGVLLEQEPVGGVWVDLDAGLRNQAG